MFTTRGYHIIQGVLYRYLSGQNTLEPRLVIPTSMEQRVMKWNHSTPESAHPGIKGTCLKILTKYYWPGMRRSVIKYIKMCEECQKFKPSNQYMGGSQISPRVPERFEVLSIDIVGPLPVTTRRCEYILTAMDVATGYLDMYPIQVATAEIIVALLTKGIFLRYGFPKALWCDNGTQFTSAVRKQVAESMGITLQYIARYHPQANLVERRHRDLRQKLAMAVYFRHDTWDNHLDPIRWSMNTTPSMVTGFSPAFLTFGRECGSLMTPY